MRTQRLYIDEKRLSRPLIDLTESERKYLLKVLRFAEGARLEIGDGKGGVWEARLVKESGKYIIELGEAIAIVGEKSKPPLSLILCIPKGDKLKNALHFAVELGASEIFFAVSERTVARPEEKKLADKLERYEETVKQAAAQAGRSDLPGLRAPMPLFDALSMAPEGTNLFFWEEEKKRLRELAEALDFNAPVTAVIGPEGGFSPREAEAARKAGFYIVGLGEEILRVDTAVASILTLLQFYRRRIG